MTSTSPARASSSASSAPTENTTSSRFGATSPTYHNGQPIAARTPLTHEDRLDAGESRASCSSPGRRPSGDGEIRTRRRDRRGQPGAHSPRRPGRRRPPDGDGRAPRLGAAPPPDSLQPIPLSGNMLIGREEGQVQVHLPHPQVSRRARPHRRQGARRPSPISTAPTAPSSTAGASEADHARPGDQIDIGPYALQFTGGAHPATLQQRRVGGPRRPRVVTDRETGKPLTLLDDINLVIRPHEFVCLLGPVRLGQIDAVFGPQRPGRRRRRRRAAQRPDLYAHFEALKQDIAVVPQKDVLHDSLSRRPALWYTARLRLPPDTSRTEIEACLERDRWTRSGSRIGAARSSATSAAGR